MDLMALLTSPQMWLAFATLTALELVLGIDNVIFISILVDRLPPETREKARRLGLFLAMFMRIALLLLLSLIVGATAPLFSVLGQAVSPRDLVLIAGGLFLVWKSTQEIHQLLEGRDGLLGVGRDAQPPRPQEAAATGASARTVYAQRSRLMSRAQID